MASLKSHFIKFMLIHRNLFQGKLKKTAITPETSVEDLRRNSEKMAAKLSKTPPGVVIKPVDLDGIRAEWILPGEGKLTRALLYFHGGGFIMGSLDSDRALAAKVVRHTGVPAVLFEYRLAPENPYPAGLDDCVTAYRWLSSRIPPEKIVLMGDSAGAGLAISTLLRLRDQNIPFPAATVAVSPCLDLKASVAGRTKKDPIAPEGADRIWCGYYVGDADPADPYISPVYADLRGLPPVYLVAGDDDALFTDSERFYNKAVTAGVDCIFKAGHGMLHCYPLLAPMFPEATRAMDEIASYIHEKLNETGE